MKDADEQARNELGSSFELVELGNVTTLSHLLEEIAVAERLDGLIDRCLKRLFFIRGLKSLSLPPPAAGSPPQLTHKAM